MKLGTTRRIVAGVAVLAVVAAGCGDDDEAETTDTTEAAEEAGTEEYCELARELDEQEDFPSVEQFEALLEASPEEIRDEAELVVPIIVEAYEDGDPFAAFEDPVVEENVEVIEAFEAEACGLGGDDEDGGDEGAVNPEFEEYCGIARELDEQEDFPSAEQLEAIRDAAPEEIGDEIDLVVEAFLAGIEAGDPAAAFDDPEVAAAFEPIEAFDAENCGIGSDEDDEEAEQDPSVTEADPNAAQVEVTATEYAFAYDPPAAGRTTFTMVNEGEERHVLVLFRLADGFTMDDVMASEGDEGIDGPELESETAAAGEEAVLTADLEPGTYGMICYLPTTDGTPHLELGMTSEFTVQ